MKPFIKICEEIPELPYLLGFMLFMTILLINSRKEQILKFARKGIIVLKTAIRIMILAALLTLAIAFYPFKWLTSLLLYAYKWTKSQ